eukprot:86245_1
MTLSPWTTYTVTLTTMVSISCIIGFIQIYSIIQFKSISNLIIIQKRYPKLVIAEASVTLILCFISIPFSFNYLLRAILFDVHKSSDHYIYILISFTSHFIANLEASRLWLISFDLHYLRSTQNEKWKSQINVNFALNNWYLTNKNIYGNPRYILRISMIYFLFAACISSIAFLYFGYDKLYLGEFIHGSFLTVPTMIIFYTYCKSPKQTNDNFLFYYELKCTAIIYGLELCIFYPLVQLMDFLGFQFIHIIFIFCMIVAGFLLPSLLSTYWIPMRIRQDKIWNEKKANINDENNKKNIDEMLKIVLCNELQFEAFLHWMYREFSSETVLSFIEMVQFKEYIIDIINKESDSETIYCKYRFYETMPKSSIVYNDYKYDNVDVENQTKCQRIASRLYCKYIQEFTQYQINISGNLRDKYQRQHESNWILDGKDLVYVFDEAVDEMFYLMLQSFNRFKTLNFLLPNTR